MKKFIYIFLIIISLLAFASLIHITINVDSVSDTLQTIGFMIIGYFSIIVFSYAWLKLVKK